MTIKTSKICPPIPTKEFDWQAIDDETYDGAEDSETNQIGFGATKELAIQDLMDKLVEL